MPAATQRFDLGQSLSIGAGLLVLAALWCGPLAPMSRTSFSPHMLVHLGVVVVASPLLGFALARQLPTPNGFGDALRWYLLAAAFEMLAVWSWHVPILHDAAGHAVSVFVLEQASFLAGGIALWTAVWTARGRGAAGAAAIALFLTFSHMSMFGLILTLAPRLLYDPTLCLGAFGLDRVGDQHFGGVLMVLGGLPYLAVAAFMVARLIAPGGTAPRAASP